VLKIAGATRGSCWFVLMCAMKNHLTPGCGQISESICNFPCTRLQDWFRYSDWEIYHLEVLFQF